MRNSLRPRVEWASCDMKLNIKKTQYLIVEYYLLCLDDFNLVSLNCTTDVQPSLWCNIIEIILSLTMDIVLRHLKSTGMFLFSNFLCDFKLVIENDQ